MIYVATMQELVTCYLCVSDATALGYMSRRSETFESTLTTVSHFFVGVGTHDPIWIALTRLDSPLLMHSTLRTRFMP